MLCGIWCFSFPRYDFWFFFIHRTNYSRRCLFLFFCGYDRVSVSLFVAMELSHDPRSNDWGTRLDCIYDGASVVAIGFIRLFIGTVVAFVGIELVKLFEVIYTFVFIFILFRLIFESRRDSVLVITLFLGCLNFVINIMISLFRILMSTLRPIICLATISFISLIMFNTSPGTILLINHILELIPQALL
ncbi:hypothetical protein FVEG_15734 [Fusarium verticillioides 7600]|uniref:Uncharacterized protein n=1 Tax=Gibberella moniliformis (strain M3125 / FGSC 7600) TaxID=334819 RepID=W7MB84_GIBM7|nr:hypothetical protein FVEG_15734 [Fusarium verticillioides 7600]XP_018751047.1 hypothetical protein FVEG_15734 [Fusarium verticillioides 7600]EWG44855.1 hypothetical protein FVEG_15734 [Fusarium verticillioides 7600]EWG44856.1 hypothetical protein FVEG_15734 [Fusarium verticillioides 7600]